MGSVAPGRGSWEWGAPEGEQWRNDVKGQREKRACVVSRGEVPRVRWEAGNGGVRALRLGGGGQEVGGRAGKVNS